MKKRLETEFQRRQYMLSRDFEIYYYNDYRLQPVEPHAHDYYELYLFLEGTLEIHIGERILLPEPGDVILVPPGLVHFPRILDPEKPYRRIVLWVSADYLEHLRGESADYGYLFDRAVRQKEYLYRFETILANQLQSLAFQMIEETWGDRFGRQPMLQLSLNTLLLFASRCAYEQTHRRRRRAGAEEEVYQTICGFINSHLEEDLSLDRLAGRFFLSKYYIAHLFKEKVGMSAHQYITRKRLAACRDAMLGSERIGQICLQYGFSDYTSFYRMFRREYGVSPQEYRRSHQLE